MDGPRTVALLQCHPYAPFWSSGRGLLTNLLYKQRIQSHTCIPQTHCFQLFSRMKSQRWRHNENVIRELMSIRGKHLQTVQIDPTVWRKESQWVCIKGYQIDFLHLIYIRISHYCISISHYSITISHYSITIASYSITIRSVSPDNYGIIFVYSYL